MRTLYLQRDGGERRAIAVGTHLHIGRGPHNGVVLGGPDVSWSHAVLRIVDEQLIAEDLGSRNGTWVDGQRIERPTPVFQSVRVGDYVLTPRDDSIDRPPGRLLFLEEVEARVRYPLSDGELVIGDAPDAAIRVAGAHPVVLTVEEGRIEVDGVALVLPWEGELAGVRVHVFAVDEDWSPTLDTSVSEAWRLHVTLEPPRALVGDSRVGLEHTIRAPNRVALLWFLATAALEDARRGVPVDKQGWRSDEDAVVAVWGRAGRNGPRNRLNTLVYRVRQELTEHGLGEDLIEKRAGWVRLGACEADLT